MNGSVREPSLNRSTPRPEKFSVSGTTAAKPRPAPPSPPPSGPLTPHPGPVTAALRNQALTEMAERFDAHAEELGTLVTKENGKKISEGSSRELPPLRRCATTQPMALTGTGISAEVAPGQWFSTYAEPAGVVGIIVPWNSPVALLIRSLGPALSAGNTVAVKMPGQTALVANLISQIIAEVESLPRGVVNIFTESGNTGAPFLVASPDVQVISYTGSTTVGRMVAAAGAPTLKRMNLELGGKTPMIVFDDADLDSTVPLLAAGITTFAGEFCMTGSRILVQRGVAEDVRARLAEILENVRVGNGLDPDTDMGPLIDKANVTRVDGLVEAALAYAKPIVRGGPATDGALAAGSFYRPTLLEVDDVNTDIVQKEVFGPVATFEVFDSETDAIARANATRDGSGRGYVHQRPQHFSPRQPRNPGRHRVDQHVGRHQRRVRRRRLQAERRWSPTRPSRHQRIPRGQDRRPLRPASRRMTLTAPPTHEPCRNAAGTKKRYLERIFSGNSEPSRDRWRMAPEPGGP